MMRRTSRGVKAPEIKLVELYAGSCTLSTMAEERYGMEALSTDNVQYGRVKLVGDILSDKVLRAIVAAKPDVIWASSPCTGFSIASVGQSLTQAEAGPRARCLRLAIVTRRVLNS